VRYDVVQKNMSDIQELMEELYDSSRWYHERGREQREFDEAVVTELATGNTIGTAVKNALQRISTMKTFVATKSMPELKEYYEQVRRIDLEIAIANNMRNMAAVRKGKAQQDAAQNPGNR
jgi:endonuclease III-like uncharacterized protein